MSTDPFIEGLILDAVSRPSDRDRQVTLGPSAVGSCAYCIGHTMAQKLPDPPPERGKGFGYAAWIGTGVHYWMEHNLKLGDGYTQHHEEKLYIGEVPGYGKISGSCDLYVPELAATFDWKFPGKWSYEKLRLALAKGGTPSNQYRYQQQFYAHGQALLGRPIESCFIVFFPRHSNNLGDVVMYQEQYQPEMVEKAFERLEVIWEYVKDGELADLESDEDCYLCATQGR